MSVLNLVSIWSLSEQDTAERLWHKARAEAQDLGRQYLSIACKGRFNI